VSDLEVREARAEGRTVAEARAKIAAELGLPEVEIKFFVLDEGKAGFLGIGARPAVVLGQALVERPVRARAGTGREERGKDQRPRPPAEAERRAAPQRPPETERAPEEPRRADASPAATELEGEEERREDAAEEAQLTGTAWHALAVSFVEGFLKALGQEEAVRAEDAGDHLVLSTGGDFDWFCQGRSDALDSLQFLCQLSVARRLGLRRARPRLVIDLGGYRKRREVELTELARRTAERVRTSGKPVRLEVMPASERRVVHMVLQGEPGVQTRSEGTDPHRYVVVTPARGVRTREGGASDEH
jgi:spoIIIJ-associated protein